MCIQIAYYFLVRLQISLPIKYAHFFIIFIINAIKIIFHFLTSFDLELFAGSDITSTNVFPVYLNE